MGSKAKETQSSFDLSQPRPLLWQRFSLDRARGEEGAANQHRALARYLWMDPRPQTARGAGGGGEARSSSRAPMDAALVTGRAA